VLGDDLEEAPEGAQEAHIGGLEGTRVQRERAAAVVYEKRQMLWKGMAGRSWTELVQQWGGVCLGRSPNLK
jgi:hypothetical protein